MNLNNTADLYKEHHNNIFNKPDIIYIVHIYQKLKPRIIYFQRKHHKHQKCFLAAKTALEATFSLVSQSKSVMLCNFRPSDLSVCVSVVKLNQTDGNYRALHFCFDIESDGRKLQSITLLL